MDGNCTIADPCKLELNPDITGIGVRVALYIQILIGWFASLIWRETFAKNSRTAYMTALALLVAAFIELTTQKLSLLDGLVVSFITTMMIAFAIASYSRAPDSKQTNKDGDGAESVSADNQPNASRWLMQFFFVIFWGAWCFNMWRDPANFGLKDDSIGCDTNYKVTLRLFTQVNATDPKVRNAALALVAIGFTIALLSLFVTLEQFMSPIFWIIGVIKGEKKEGTEETTRKLSFNKYEDNPTLQGIHLAFQALTIGTFIFLIYATEKTISQNDGEGETRDWSYGQTIALLLLLQQIMDLFSTYIEEREKAEAERERRNMENGDVPGYPGLEMPALPTNPNDPNANTAPPTPAAK